MIGQEHRGQRYAAVAVMTLLALAMVWIPAQTEARDKGQFWTYDITLSEEIMGLQAEASGTVTFSVVGESTVALNGTDHAVSVVDVDGSLDGSVYLLGKDAGDVGLSISGTQKEAIDTGGIIEENLTTIGDVRLGSGLFSFSYHLQEQVIVVSDPPVLAGFDPDNASVGESWARAVELETTTISWEDGEISNRTTDVKNLNYTLSVLASESVETPSGTYSALKVKVSDDAGNCDFYWWSSDVDNFVKHEVYKAGLATPTMTLVLTDHGSEASTDWTMYLIVGVVIFVAAAAILAVIVLRGRSFDK